LKTLSPILYKFPISPGYVHIEMQSTLKSKYPRKKKKTAYVEHAEHAKKHFPPFVFSYTTRCVLHSLGLTDKKVLECVINCKGERKTRNVQRRMALLLQTKGLKPEVTGVQWKFYPDVYKLLINRDQYAFYVNACRMEKSMPPILKASVGDFFVPSKCHKHGLNSHAQQVGLLNSVPPFSQYPIDVS